MVVWSHVVVPLNLIGILYAHLQIVLWENLPVVVGKYTEIDVINDFLNTAVDFLSCGGNFWKGL